MPHTGWSGCYPEGGLDLQTPQQVEVIVRQQETQALQEVVGVVLTRALLVGPSHMGEALPPFGGGGNDNNDGR